MTGTPTHKPEAALTHSRIDPRVWQVALVVSIGSFMAQMDSTLVNVSLSSIGHTLGAPLAATQWIVSGYLLAMALMLPLNGWLVDHVGAKRLYLFCFAAFTFASMLCGAAHGVAALIGARLLQGLVAGVLAPMAQMMIGRVGGQNMQRVMGYTTLPILLGPIAGPVLAGAILAHASWSWLFFVNVPIGVLGVALAARMLPRDTVAAQPRPFDFAGFALVSPGLVALIYGLQGSLLCLCAGFALLVAFVLYARSKGEAALIDVRIFQGRTFRVAALVQFFANGIMFGRQLAVPLFLIAGCELSASHAGGLVAIIGIGMMISFAILGILTDRFGCRAVAAGGALLALLGTLAFVWMAFNGYSSAWAVASLFLAGLGQGTISVPSIAAAYASLPKTRMPVANTALNIAQRIGGPFATTLISMSLVMTPGHASGVQVHHFEAAFVVLALLHALCLAATLWLPMRIERTPQR
ncbi:EmrB/QacA subfamily drug resistance transporter [Paraburkholderia eburnea]|uniref:EmrB/QacA subfamily drug resistance transporter n=1 Tax=Paraburkholderia eburnea TaxID=1189126 RepID=A0A2S4M2H0_9BURK|nr:DHA2 family efflux MFS transporter permease subunit [Paraburkholderia eburnea]POR48825.1 EmrB/QacA subfamily drug resistance transporter [Paraburkholderia eburnea]PRZ20940.1 EmrB/QacA subfamily drug resistance transporter [Paraburkholderia eburnea]